MLVGDSTGTTAEVQVSDLATIDVVRPDLLSLVESTPDPFLGDFEIWASEASHLPRWQAVLPELTIRVDQAIDRYERIRGAADTTYVIVQ